jgi:hypothetical protein
MHGKTRLFLLLSVLLITSCTSFAGNSITYSNGLSCRNSTDGANCSYTCPDGSTEQVTVSGSVSPIYAASSEELDEQFCGIPAPSTPTPRASATPTPRRTQTLAVSPTSTGTASATVTAEPLLSESISMCDLGGKLINFRILAPATELSDETLNVEIAGDETTCYVNPTNRSLLTCTLPNNIRFPAHIVVTLDGALVNDFMYSGLGCSVLTTPTTGPRSYP